MLISRALPLLRGGILRSNLNSNVQRLSQPSRSSSGRFHYRNADLTEAGSPSLERAADIAYIFAWWWIFYHTFTKYDHLIGEYPWPDASKWTDEELGVPPDNYEPPSRA